MELFPFHYLLYGLHIASEIPLRGPSNVRDGSTPDIVVRRKALPWERLPVQPGMYCDQYGLLLLRPRNREESGLLVRNANEIWVEFEGDSPSDPLVFAVVGPAMAACNYMRGHQVLHGASVVRDGKATALIAVSGRGKSTLSGVMVDRGWSLLSDDITIVTRNSSGHAIVWPGEPLQKFTNESCEILDREPGAGTTYYAEKWHQEETRFSPESACLEQIILLRKSKGKELTFNPVTGVRKVHLLQRYCYRRDLIDTLNIRSDQIALAGQLGTDVPIYEVFRPQDLSQITKLADIVEEL